MKAVDMLKDEHRTIERVLAAISMVTTNAGHGTIVRPDFYTNSLGFLDEFIEGIHFKKEDVVFKILDEHGISSQSGTIGSLINEHKQSHEFLSSLRSAAEQWQKGDSSARSDVIWAASSYVRHFRDHVQKENSILFALFEQNVPEEEKTVVTDVFKRMNTSENGENLQDKYKKAAATIEDDASDYKI